MRNMCFLCHRCLFERRKFLIGEIQNMIMKKIESESILLDCHFDQLTSHRNVSPLNSNTKVVQQLWKIVIILEKIISKILISLLGFPEIICNDCTLNVQGNL